MALTVERIICGTKPMCEYTTKYAGALELYEKDSDYVVAYRAELNNVDLIILTITGEFSHAAHVYETVKKQMVEVEKGVSLISQAVRMNIAEKCVGWLYRSVNQATSYRTASNYKNIKQGMDDAVAPIIEQYLKTVEDDDVDKQ